MTCSLLEVSLTFINKLVHSLKFHFISGCDVGHCISACPHGWEENGDSCFFWSSAENSWDDAEAWCKRQDSHLASVLSPSIREYILNSMKRKNIEKLWLGGNDKDYEGIWSWADCSFFGFTSWASGEPNNQGTEHCMEMVKDWTGAGRVQGEGMWNDVDCTHKLRYLCSKRRCSGGI